MALFKFTRRILAGEPIEVYSHGDHARDFTYIDDIVEGMVRILDILPTADPNWSPASPDPATASVPYRVYNIGNGTPVNLMHFIACIEETLGKKAKQIMRRRQLGDVASTYADVTDLVRDTGFKPKIPVEEGIRRFVDWYRAFYNV